MRFDEQAFGSTLKVLPMAKINNHDKALG